MFRELFVPAYDLAYRLLGTREDAQDAASEAMARALADWKRVSTLPHLRPWVLRVTSNVAIDMVRRRRATPDGDRVGGALASAATDGDTEERIVLNGVLARLPRRQLEVVILRYLADLSEEDVATSLGISPGSVKTHASRGLAALRRRMSTYDGKETVLAY